jgi:hypothetical protein
MNLPSGTALAIQLTMYLTDLRNRIEALQAEEREVTERLAEEYAAVMETAARLTSTSGVSRR